MSGRPRSLAELKDTEAHIHPHENELVVPVTHAEALKLHKTGAIVFSGCSRVNSCCECQRYLWNGKTYLWVAKSRDETFPIPNEYGEMLHNFAINAGD